MRLIFTLIAVLASATALAGPCPMCDFGSGPVKIGWRDDRPLSGVVNPAVAPRVDAGEAGGIPRIAAVWEERLPRGDGDIMLAMSDDGGCSFALTAVTAGTTDDRLPDVVIAPALNLVVVAFVREGLVFTTRSSDGGVTFEAPLAHGVDPVDADGPPRLAGIVIDGKLHLHLVWIAAGNAHYERDPDGGGNGWIPKSPFFAAARNEPKSIDVAAETTSIDPMTQSGVNIVFTARSDLRTVRESFVLRSNDSGATFYGDPTDLASLDSPRRISDPRADDLRLSTSGTLIDGNDDGSGVFYTWNAVAWSEEDIVGVSGGRADARAEEGGTPSIVSDWNEPPIKQDAAPALTPARAVALAAVPNPLARPPMPELQIFLESGGEVALSHGLLDPAGLPSTVKLPCAVTTLTGQAPARSSGQVVAGSFAADEDLSHVYVVWTDTRDGIDRVYFKRTDSNSAAPVAVVATPLPCPLGGGIEVSWTAPADPPHCDVEHYLVEWGTTSLSYTASVEVRGGERTVLSGLAPATPYFIRVSTYDEACNQRSAFETSAVTVADCGGPLCPNGIRDTLRAIRRGPDVELTWQPPLSDVGHDPALSYLVYRAVIRARDGYLAVAAPTPMTFTDPDAIRIDNLSPHHYYRIVAVNQCGTSADVPLP